MGYGIEQKVLEVLQRWHFRPAMRDGVTIASQHIVHFHYPGLDPMPPHRFEDRAVRSPSRSPAEDL